MRQGDPLWRRNNPGLTEADFAGGQVAWKGPDLVGMVRKAPSARRWIPSSAVCFRAFNGAASRHVDVLSSGACPTPGAGSEADADSLGLQPQDPRASVDTLLTGFMRLSATLKMQDDPVDECVR